MGEVDELLCRVHVRYILYSSTVQPVHGKDIKDDTDQAKEAYLDHNAPFSPPVTPENKVYKYYCNLKNKYIYIHVHIQNLIL